MFPLDYTVKNKDDYFSVTKMKFSAAVQRKTENHATGIASHGGSIAII